MLRSEGVREVYGKRESLCLGLRPTEAERLSPVISCGFGRFQPPNECESRDIADPNLQEREFAW